MKRAVITGLLVSLWAGVALGAPQTAQDYKKQGDQQLRAGSHEGAVKAYGLAIATDAS